ncbi:MAG: C40 family peptidase [Acidothermaceae bacterium]
MKAVAIGIVACLAVFLGLPILLVLLLGGASPAAAAITAAGIGICATPAAASPAPTNPSTAALPALDPNAQAAARAIVATGQAMNIDPTGQVIALDVALARTNLHGSLNGLSGGVGVFAMTPSPTAPAEALGNAAQAAELFYEHLTATPQWTFLATTEAAKQALPELVAGSYAAELAQAQQIFDDLLAAAAASPIPNPLPAASATAASPTPPASCEPSETALGDAGLDGALAFARSQVGKPYVLGANGPDAWDCSSLVQAAFRTAGIALPRVADNQYEWVRDHATVFPGPPSPDELQPGDLLFSVGDDPDTTDDGQHIGHVAIYAGGGEVIEAEGARWGVVETTYTPGHWAYVTWVGRLPAPSPTPSSPPATSPSPSSPPTQ